MSEWRETTLGEIAILNYGKALKMEDRESGEVAVYSSAGITGWHNKPIVKGKGIIIGRKGTVGSVYYAYMPFYCIDTAYYIKEDENKYDLKFLYYYLKYLRLDRLNEDSAVPGLNRDNAYLQDIYLPNDIPEQKRISRILSVLDDKIDLLRGQNETLEAIAQTLFKRWFVEFEFPDENGRPYKSSGGKMVSSELGEIPEAWRVGRFNEISINFDSKRIPLSKNERENRKGIYPYYGATSILDYIDDYIFDGIFVLMAEDGTVIDNKGFPILQYIFGKFWVNNHTHVLQGKSPFSTNYIYTILKRTKVNSIVTGAVQPKINQGNMNSIKVTIPHDKRILNSFNKLTDNIFAKIRLNVSNIKLLVKTRNLLLPKLMNGQIRVKEK